MRRFLLSGALALWGALPCAAQPSALRVCDDVADPVTLDPHRAFENKSDTIIQQIFEGLLRLDAEGAIEPALATECRRLDPITLRCELRRGVMFHNGEPFDAEAVRFSLERQLDPKTGYPALSEISFIQEVRVVDPYVVEIRTRGPGGLLRRRLASFVKIIPPKYFQRVGADAFREAPVGTGPFKFVRWEKGKAIHLEANPEYWNKGLPRVRSASFLFVPPERQLPMLFSGELDLVTEIPATRTLEVAQNEGTRVLKRLVLTTPAFWFTSFSGPLADRRVRRALNLAVDKEQLIRYAVLGNGKSVATLSMEGDFGRDASLKPYPYDPDKAKELLREAGYPEGFPLSMLAVEQAGREARILAEQWGRVGVRAEITVLPLSEVHLSMVHRKREYDISANLAPNPTAHMYFLAGVCFHSRSLFSRLKSPEFDRRYEALSSAPDPAEQARLAAELDAFIHEEALGVFTYQKNRTYALRRGLELGIPVTGMLDLKEAYWKP